MKKYLLIFILFVFSLPLSAIEITRMEPAFWWVGMKNHELQILVYGKNISRSTVELDYPGVHLIDIDLVYNPDYLFLYLDIEKEAQPGTLNFIFTEGKKKLTRTYELKARSQTTGAQGFSTADVLYLIMPDRFANGDPSNDVWDNEPVNRKDPFARHGGDFAGITKQLDYLQDLGVTTIWLNPVQENKMHSAGYQSYHGYAITDFYQVDKRFGSNEEYVQLVEQIHGKGMKVVMDMIYNHCGSNHWWIGNLPSNDWLNHSDGFVPTTHNLYSVMDPHAPESEVRGMTDGWFVEAMPDLNQRHPVLATYLIQNSIWWIEYARIDGIRHDTHPYADFDFLSQWNKAVTREYPDFNMVGESWYVNSAPLAWWQRNSKLDGKQSNLKTVMDFSLMKACDEAFSINPKENNQLSKIYEVLAQDFLYEDLNNILVFLDNHDLSRFVKKEETDLSRYKQALAFLLTTRGIPQLYYGTEIWMNGEKNEGDGMLRKDFPGGWAEDTINAFTASGRTDLQNEAHDYLQKLLQWRKTSKAVQEGELIHYAPGWQRDYYVYARSYEPCHSVLDTETTFGGSQSPNLKEIAGQARNDREVVLVILNGSTEAQTLLPEKYYEVIGNAVSGKEIISGKTIDLKKEITIPAKGVYIVELK